MTMQEKARLMREETLELLRNKSVKSTLTERWFLLEEAWKLVRDLPQPLQEGKGLTYVLERASLPVSEHDLLLGRFIDKVPTEEEEARFQEIWRDQKPLSNPITMVNASHITLDWEHILSHGVSGYIQRVEQKLESERAADAPEKTLVFLEGRMALDLSCLSAIHRALQRGRAGSRTARAGRRLRGGCRRSAKHFP